MHFRWLTFLVYKEGPFPSNIHAMLKGNIQTIIQTESIQYLHKKFNNSFPQRPEVDEQHCNEVTKRHLVKDVMIYTLLVFCYICIFVLYIYYNLKYTFYRLLCTQKVYFNRQAKGPI